MVRLVEKVIGHELLSVLERVHLVRTKYSRSSALDFLIRYTRKKIYARLVVFEYKNITAPFDSPTQDAQASCSSPPNTQKPKNKRSWVFVYLVEMGGIEPPCRRCSHETLLRVEYFRVFKHHV